MTMLQTNPGAVAIATTDYPTIEFLASPILAAGESIASAQVRMQTADFNRQVNLPDSPTNTTTTVSQPIKGSLLTAGTLYRLIWVLTLNNGQIISQQTSATCPY